MDLFKEFKEFDELPKTQKINFVLVFGNLVMYIDNLALWVGNLLNLGVEVNNTLLSTILTCGGISAIVYSWTWLSASISSIKFYRKYIKRNKVWIREFITKDGAFKWTPLSDLYIKPSVDTSDTILINVEEIVNGYNMYGKNHLLALINDYKRMNLNLNHDYEYSFITPSIDNQTKKNIEYTLVGNIHLINLREKNINIILGK
jgi:hypothetical protein